MDAVDLDLCGDCGCDVCSLDQDLTGDSMRSTTYLLLFLCLFLTACGLLSPEQQQTALEVVSQMKAQGTITDQQFYALQEAILSGGQGVWWEQLATALLGAGLGYLGVRVNRGAPTQKVGLPVGKIIAPAAPADLPH